jgi:hypothetical protein
MFGPGSVLEGDVFVIAGDYREARKDIEAMHDAQTSSNDVLSPFGAVDTPFADQVVTGIVPVSGWIMDDVAVGRIEVLVDGKPVGLASYGFSRPDVATVFPNAPEQIGFSYPLDTRRLSPGPHEVVVRASDKSGNVAVFRGISIVVSRE